MEVTSGFIKEKLVWEKTTHVKKKKENTSEVGTSIWMSQKPKLLSLRIKIPLIIKLIVLTFPRIHKMSYCYVKAPGENAHIWTTLYTSPSVLLLTLYVNLWGQRNKA